MTLIPLTLLTALATGALRGDVPDGEVVRGPIAARIDLYLTRLSGLGYSGGIIVEKGGEVILSKGYGFADRSTERRFTPDTRFTIGSLTKQFTGAAIVKAQSMGLLDVDDELSKYFPDAPEDRADVSIHELLTHTAALPAASGFDYDPFSREDLERFALSTPLRWAPGTRYAYSNVGFSVAAAILERVSGTSYEEFTQRHLFGPAGMTRTGYLLSDRKEHAKGYLGDEDWGFVHDHYWTDAGPAWHLVGNGGTWSTLKDMYRWHVALLGDEVLSEDEKETLFTPYVREFEGEDSFYAYGWVIATTDRGTRVIWHDGGNPFFSNDFRRFVEEDSAYLLTSNDGRWRSPDLTRFIEAMLFGEELPLPPEVTSVDAARLPAFAGVYELPSGDLFQVTAEDGGLRVEPIGQDAFSLAMAAALVDADVAVSHNERSEDVVRAAFDPESDEPALNGGIGAALRNLAAEGGRLRGCRALGTFPNRALGDASAPGTLTTFVRVTTDGDEGILAVIWRNDALVGLDLPGDVAAPSLYPSADREFVAFDPGSPVRLRVRFDDAEDEPAFLAVPVDGGEVIARRRQ